MESINGTVDSGNREIPSGVGWALHAARSGIPVFPIIPGRKTPYIAEATATALGIDPDGPAGVYHARSDEASVRALWAGDRKDALIGLAMGAGRLAIDVDERDGKSGSATMLANGWTVPATASQRTPSGGWHYLLAVPNDTRAPTDTMADGLDRRGDGGHIVLYDPTMLTADRAAAPAWAVAGKGTAGDRMTSETAERAPSFALARAALWSRHPSDMERSEWLAFSGSFHTATAGLMDDADALADWLAWNAQHGATDDPSANRRTWSNFARSGTAGDWRTLARMGDDLNAKATGAFGAGPPTLPPGASATPLPVPSNDNRGEPLFVRVADMVAHPPVFLIDGLLEQDAVGAVFGDPAAGKSLVTIDLAACVATGETFHSRTVRAGPVFYIAGEGNSGLRRRFAAWEELRGRSLASAPLFASQTAIQLLEAASGARLTAAIDALALSHGSPKLIVIDTLNRNFGAGDENSTADMTAFVAAVDRLRERFAGCTVLIVHHSGHGDKDRARGSSVLRAALDTEYKVSKSGDAVTLTNHKMKDAPPPRAMSFAIVEAAGSIALEYTGEPSGAGAGKSITPTEQLALDAFNAVAVDGAASVEAWRSEFYRLHSSDKPDTKLKAFSRGREGLCDRALLQSDDSREIYNRPPMPGQPPAR